MRKLITAIFVCITRTDKQFAHCQPVILRARASPSAHDGPLRATRTGSGLRAEDGLVRTGWPVNNAQAGPWRMYGPGFAHVTILHPGTLKLKRTILSWKSKLLLHINMQQNRDTHTHTHTQELVDITSPEQNEQRPTAENRSDIWEFSTKNLQGDKCTCNFCGASYSCGKSKS